MLVDFGKAGFVTKAKQQPDKVRMVLDKIKTDGLLPTIEAVKAKLDQPLPMGYCNVGRVIETDEKSGFKIGDRVASNGNHAEVVNVPANLCTQIPSNVSDESAAFTVIGAISLQGLRLAQPTLGECFVVTGLGLVGLMTVQLLLAHGCRVLGIDFDGAKCSLAKSFGAVAVDLSKGEDPLAAADIFSRGRGVDGVLVCASSKGNEIMHQAASMCRKRGRIILVGVVGLELSRADFFAKELTFQVSCSYGPGRYDPLYEEQGQDYPLGYVRWTEQRNFEAVLDMMADGRLDVEPLISHRFPLEQAVSAYKVLAEDRSAMGILLEYPKDDYATADKSNSTVVLSDAVFPNVAVREPVVGFIGSGNYAGRVLIPAFKETGAVLRTVASSGGVSGVHVGKKYGFHQTTTDTASLLSDPQLNIVVITTRHNIHASQTVAALQAGKHVFVEKPLCLSLGELDEIEKLYSTLGTAQTAPPLLMVGFNRRFAPQIQKVKSLLTSVQGAKSFVMTVNAGAIPPDHWTQDPAVGGGRIIGEACHFIDLLRFLSGHAISQHTITKMAGGVGDTVTIQLGFADGSIGTVHYLANGSKSFPKERLEVFAAGRILQLDNFRKMKGYDWPGFKKMNLFKQDKGQKACAAAFVGAIREGGVAPIPVDEIFEVSRVTLELAGA
ncbi:bi-domain-containing oxidoreductase [Desulfocastanea catecholica]